MRERGLTRVTTVAAVAAAIVLFGAGVWKHRYSVISSGDILRYGQTVKPATLDHQGQPVTLGSGRWDVIVVDDSGSGVELATYLQFLLDSGRYAKSAVNPVVLTRHGSDGSMPQTGRFRMPVVSLTSNEGTLIRRGYLFGEQRIVFISPEKRVAFANSFARPNDLRQLFDKFIPRAQSAVELRAKAIAPGDVLPAIAMTPLTASSPPAGPATYVIFGGKCGSCVLTSYTLLFSSTERDVLRQATAAGAPVSLVFSSLLPSRGVRERLEELKIQSPAFIAEEPMRGIEGDYSETRLSESDVVVITTDAGNHVVSVDPFEAYVRRVKG